MTAALTAAPDVAAGAPAVIDPLAPMSWHGVWHGARVTVRRVARDRLRTGTLRGHRSAGRLIVEHRLGPGDLCDDLATVLLDGLADTEQPCGQAEFEELFTGVVRSTVAGAQRSWLRFYRNSMRRLESGAAEFAPVHDFAAAHIRGGAVLDLGSCFGFFPLRLAARGFDVVATDLSAPTADLLARMSRALHHPLRTLACDAARVPLPDRCADTVTALHLLEHLPADRSGAVVTEALRLARRRVVIAVPFETEPTACHGHLQRFGPAELHQLADRLRALDPGLQTAVSEHHGGWLVLDR